MLGFAGKPIYDGLLAAWSVWMSTGQALFVLCDIIVSRFLHSNTHRQYQIELTKLYEKGET
jgi:hypothetical protein